jgi:hypothetical protein
MLDVLRQDGIFVTSPMAVDRVDAIVNHLTRWPMYGAHVAAKATEPPVPFSAACDRYQAFAPHMRDVLTAPYWFELACSFFDAARAYFDGADPWLYSLNAFWTRPGPTYTDTQTWHRDHDDDRQLAIFMLGTDVLEPADGEHEYQGGSHAVSQDDLGYEWHMPPEDRVIRVGGPRGTIFVCDPWGLHRGIPPQQHRLLLWARWCVTPTPRVYGVDRLAPVPRALLGDRYPADPALQEAIKLVVS